MESRDEIELLKNFFGLSEKEVRLVICEDIGKDDWLKKTFFITPFVPFSIPDILFSIHYGFEDTFLLN